MTIKQFFVPIFVGAALATTCAQSAGTLIPGFGNTAGNYRKWKLPVRTSYVDRPKR